MLPLPFLFPKLCILRISSASISASLTPLTPHSLRLPPFQLPMFRLLPIALAALAATMAPVALACEFDVTVDSCSFSRVRNQVQAADTECDFSDADLKSAIRAACRTAKSEADAGLPLSGDDESGLIPEFDDQDLDNFFMGGTYWNENTGQVRTTEDEEGEMPIIGEIYDNTAKEATISFPSGRAIRSFSGCRSKAVMCLWTRDRQANDDNGNCRTPYDTRCIDKNPADNTDVCYSDSSRCSRCAHVPEGRTLYLDNAEGATHAHGFTWQSGQDARFRGNLLFYISMYDHLSQRGYAENLPGAPMCGCIESMPTVSRADCTELAQSDEEWRVTHSEASGTSAERLSVDIAFQACAPTEEEDEQDVPQTANDLYAELARRLSHRNEDFAEEMGEHIRQYITDDDCPEELPEE